MLLRVHYKITKKSTTVRDNTQALWWLLGNFFQWPEGHETSLHQMDHLSCAQLGSDHLGDNGVGSDITEEEEDTTMQHDEADEATC